MINLMELSKTEREQIAEYIKSGVDEGELLPDEEAHRGSWKLTWDKWEE